MSDLSAEHRKRREAALKAWETIRKRHREERVKGATKLTNYIDLEAVRRIKHPEELTERPPEEVWSGNGVVKLFHKTPLDIACGSFWELRWAYGCPLNCSYCYLRGTTRGRMKPQYVRIEVTLRCIEEAFKHIKEPTIFNSGELSDSLMNPPLMAKIVDKFEEQNIHKIFLLTKFGTRNIGFLLERPRKQVICGWSINAAPVAEKWETAAAKPSDRIEAASLVWEAEYDTRIRIDPIFPINNWKVHYGNLLDNIFSSLWPNRIILGTPRGLWKTIHYAEKAGVDISWIKFFKENTGWGKKLSFEQRKEIYSFFYSKIESLGYPTFRISMCKETTTMWEALGLDYTPGSCNCYSKDALKFSM